MSIAYLDPGNIESDLQSGAVANFKVHYGARVIKWNDVASVSELPMIRLQYIVWSECKGKLYVHCRITMYTVLSHPA